VPDLDGNPAGPTPSDNVLGASFLVDGSGTGESQLPNRRILTAGTNVTFVDNGAGGTLVINATGGGASDHGALTGLGDDDHTQYALLAGRGTGQTLIGGAASGNNLLLQSTSDATRGVVRSVDNMEVTRSADGVAVTMKVQNTSNTANSHSDLIIQHGGTSGGRAGIRFLGGTREWALTRNAGSNYVLLQDLTAVRDRWSINDTLMGFGHSSPTAHFHFVRPPGGGNNTNIQYDNDQAAGVAECLYRHTASNVDLFMSVNGASTGASRFGSSSQSFAEITSGGSGSAGLLLGTRTSDPLVVGTNDTEAFRVTSSDQRLQFAAGSVVANGTGTVTRGNVAPGTTARSVVEWLAVYNTGGTLRYIELYG
jgi:hypothetical protein